MLKLVLFLGGVAALAAALITVTQGLGKTDDYGRVSMPGEKAIALEPGSYSIYYEVQVPTRGNSVFEPPEGISLRVRGLGDAPDPEIDLGGPGNQVGTDDTTAETIGKIRIEDPGRYGVVVGPPPEPAFKPAITFGEKFSTSFFRGARRVGYIAAVTLLLTLLVLLGRLVRGRASAPAVPSHAVPSPSRMAPAVPYPAGTSPAVTFSAYSAPPPSPAKPAARVASLEELERLAALRRSGVITDDELARLKRHLTGGEA